MAGRFAVLPNRGGHHARAARAAEDPITMCSRTQFAPLCDVHHTPMRRVMLEEDTDEIRSYHACKRRDCTRIFRDDSGYSDMIGGQFDASRASVRKCPQCQAVLYLAEVDHSLKVETWECPGQGCDFSGEFSSPSGQ